MILEEMMLTKVTEHSNLWVEVVLAEALGLEEALLEVRRMYLAASSCDPAFKRSQYTRAEFIYNDPFLYSAFSVFLYSSPQCLLLLLAGRSLFALKCCPYPSLTIL